MKLLVTISLVALVFLSQGNAGAPSGSDIEVMKFGWKKYRIQEGDPLVHGLEGSDPTGNSVVVREPPRSNEPAFIRNNRDLQQRAADLRGGETDAALSASQSYDVFLYRIELKNVSTRVIKNVALEYSSSVASRDAAVRQFFCSMKAEPNEVKGLQAVSYFSPDKVVNVSDTDKSPKARVERVGINRIEYEDGSVWQRSGWDATILNRGEKKKIGGGKCISL